MQGFDVLVIGNGISGYSTAYALSLEDPSLKVGIIGPSSRLSGATGAAGAMLGCFGEVTQAGISSRFGLKKLEMSVQSAKMWPSWLGQINNSNHGSNKVQIIPGTFVILNSKSGVLDSQNYAATIQALNKYNEPYEEIPPSEISGISPLDDCRPLRALYLPNEGAINPSQLLNAIHSIISNHSNLTVIDETVESINVIDGKVKNVEVKSGGKFEAKCVLLASGTYSQSLIDRIPELKNRIPKLIPAVGYSMLLEVKDQKLSSVVRTPNRAGACGLHVLPQSKDVLYVGASNNLALIPEDSLRVGMINFIFECLLEQIDTSLYNANVLKFLVGNRPATVDTFPLIGKTSIDGLWLLTGTYRDGIHQSPLLAQSIARQILGKSPLFDNLFSPERLPIQTMNKEQAIKEAVLHYMGGAYEHAIQLPRIGWNLMLEEMIHQRIETVYRELDIDIGLPPDLIIMIERDMKKLVPYFREYYHSLDRKNFVETDNSKLLAEDANCFQPA